MEQKSNKGLLIVIAILLIAVSFLGGIVFNDKVLNKDNTTKEETKKEENKKEEKETETVNDGELSDIIKSLNNDNATFEDETLYFNSLSELSDSDITRYAINRALSKNVIKRDKFSAADIKKMVNVDFEPKSVNDECMIWGQNQPFDSESIGFKYDTETKMFTEVEDGLGNDRVIEESINEVKSATKDGDIYTIEVYKVFISDPGIGIPNITYHSGDETIYVSEPHCTINDEGDMTDCYYDEPTKEILFKDKSKLKVYKYTFLKDEYGYMLQSYSIEN